MNKNTANYLLQPPVLNLDAGKWVTTGTFTFPKAGTYKISFSANFSSGTGSYIQGLRIQFSSLVGQDIPFLHNSIANQQSGYSHFAVFKANEGDSINIQVYASVSRNITDQKIVIEEIFNVLS